ncbi:ABC transporter substrate-binding protein, partial [Mesorhizobium sp. GbtcB19]|uniref:ABC transporter substrate-binding protein n=1 Tax=Mesorhizobium sp. GbtcB19 TaxID=2824764 RepID=UPI0027D249F0
AGAGFPCGDGPDPVPKPPLGESWKPNGDGTVWTFTPRKGGKFHSGGEKKAEDVIPSNHPPADPGNSSNALSVFPGNLQKGAPKKVD